MAAEAKFNVKWTSDIKELRRSFAEVDKLNKKHDKGRDSVRKKETAAHKEELKRTRDLVKFKDDANKKELKHHERQLKHHHRLAALEKRHHSTMARSKDKERRDDEEHEKKEAKKGFGQKLGRFALGAVGFGVGSIVGMLVGAAFKGFETYLGVQKSLGGMIGVGFRGGAMRNAGAAGGARYGYNVAEAASMAPAAARATGQATPAAVRALMAGTRATGMEGGEVADIFAAIRQGGTSFAPQTAGRGKRKEVFNLGVREFEKIQAGAMFSGLEKARFPEFAQGIASMIRRAGSTAAGVVDAAGYAKLAALFGKIGGEGFKGQRGMEKLARFEQGIINPGGGDEGEAVIMQALGFGRPGTGVGFLQAKRRQERGLRGPEGVQTFKDVMGYINQYAGGNRDERAYMGKQLGLAGSMEDMDALQKIYEETKDDKEIQQKLEEQMKKTAPLEQQGYEAMKESRTELGRIASKFDESAKRGAEASGFLEKIEDWQDEFVNFMFKQIPLLVKDIEYLAGAFKDLWNDFKIGINLLVQAIPGLGKKKIFDVDMPAAAKAEAQEQFKKRFENKFGTQLPYEMGVALTPEQERRRDILSARAAGMGKQYGDDFGEKFFQWGMDKDVDTIRDTKQLPQELKDMMAARAKAAAKAPPSSLEEAASRAAVETAGHTKEMNERQRRIEQKQKHGHHVPADPGTSPRPGTPTAPGSAGRADSTDH